MTRGISFPPSDFRCPLPVQDAADRPAPVANDAAPPAAGAPGEERGPVAMSHTQHALLRQWNNDNQPIDTPLANSEAALESSSSSQPAGAGQGRTIEPHLLKAKWKAWAQAGGASGGNRQEAVKRMEAWLAANRPDEVLDLSRLELTSLPDLPASLQAINASYNRLASLPDLPASLQKLDVSYNLLTSLPENLPASLQEINAYENRLTSLPENLPASLQDLVVSFNWLTRLPENLPASLQTLNVSDNTRLASLPENLPASLQTLNVSGNELTSLPENLPASLQTLNVYNNELTSLPENLPASLQNLNASYNRLTSLPENLPASLRELDVSRNPLTSLPESILTLSNECEIYLDASHLSEAVRNRLAFAMDADDYNGPDIYYDMGSGGSTPARPLPEEVASWSRETGQTDLHDWSAFHAEPNASQFSQFLGRLRETGEYLRPNLRPDFQQRVQKLLVQLQGDEALRATCFNLASDAVNTCGDRVALRMLDMETVCLDKRMEADIESGVYDPNPQALVDHCKGKYRQQIVADAASEKIKTMNFRDEIEVMLGFIVAFNTEFKLPVQMNTMLYPRCSGIKAMDLLNARQKLSNQKLTDQKLSGGEQKVLALAERILLTGVEQTNLSGDEKQILTGVAQPELSAAQENALKKGLVDAAKEWELTDAGRAENNRSFHEFLANADVIHALLKRQLPQEREALQGKIAAAIEGKKGELQEALGNLDDTSSTYEADAARLMREFNDVESSITASVNKELIAGFIESRSINAALD